MMLFFLIIVIISVTDQTSLFSLHALLGNSNVCIMKYKELSMLTFKGTCSQVRTYKFVLMKNFNIKS